MIDDVAGRAIAQDEVPTTRAAHHLPAGSPVALETGTVAFFVARQLATVGLAGGGRVPATYQSGERDAHGPITRARSTPATTSCDPDQQAKVREDVEAALALWPTHGEAEWKRKLMIRDAIADIVLQQTLTCPRDFDVIATPNLNGDYLSDALAAQVGGIGIAGRSSDKRPS